MPSPRIDAVPSSRAAAPSERAVGWLLVACLALAIALRLPGLGAGLWFDEIQTLVDYVRQPIGQIVTTFDSQNQHLLYSVLARLSVASLGETAAALRLPSVILGVLSILAFFRLARRVVPVDEALVGAFALALSYHHVWFSQNARGYTGLLLFSLLATVEFWELLRGEDNNRGRALRYGVWMALAMYTHLTAGAVVAAHLLVLAGVAMTPAGRGAARRGGAAVVLAGLFAAILYAPVLGQIARTMFGPNPFAADSEWESPLWLIAETVRGLVGSLPGGWLALAVVVLVGGSGLVSFWRRDRRLTLLMILPGIITAAVVLATGHNLWPRFFFFSAGFAVLIAVRGGFAVAERLLPRGGRLLAQVGAAAAIAASGFLVPRAWGPKQDFGGAAAHVERARSADDAVVTVDLTDYPYRRYFGRRWPTVTSLDSLETVERQHPRTWLLYTFPIRLAAVQPGIWERLAQAYDTSAVFPGTVGGGAVVVMVSRTRDGPT